MIEKIAKIKSTMLGYEDHGILTVWLHLTYGGGAEQGAGGYALDRHDETARRRIGTAYGCEFIARTMQACGVDKWEDLPGRTIIALKDDEWGTVQGIKPLPTEPGKKFIFADLAAEMLPEQVAS